MRNGYKLYKNKAIGCFFTESSDIIKFIANGLKAIGIEACYEISCEERTLYVYKQKE